MTSYRRTGGNEDTKEFLQTVSDLLHLTKLFEKIFILLIYKVLAKLTNVPQQHKLTDYRRKGGNEDTKEMLQTVSDLLDLTKLFGKVLILLIEYVLAKLTNVPQQQKLTNYKRPGGNKDTK